MQKNIGINVVLQTLEYMKKSALIAFLLASMLPLAGYIIVKYYSKDAVIMPKHYFHDSVGTYKGKPDTLWHKVKSIDFTNQFGAKVNLDELKGKIIVMDFFFTRCPVVCPGLTRNMKRLQDSFIKNDSIVQFISVSVDPEYDSAVHLRKFADRFKVNHDNWWFLTGKKEEVYRFAIEELKANIADPKVDTAFIHTEYFYLLDTSRVVRGFYNGFDTMKLASLARDIPTLMLEKNKKAPSVFRDFISILPLIFIGMAGVLIITLLLARNKKKND